jgi:predicted N-acetyltransferase YhbS
MVMICYETAFDVAARETLLDAAFGEARFAKTAQRLREDRLPADGLSFVARSGGQLIGTVRLWDVSAGPGCPALLLGPLAVAAPARNRGVGSALMRGALDAAREGGHAAVWLVGDAPYYGRFGFSAEKTGKLWLPGLPDRSRLLGRELATGALDGVRGSIRAPKKPARTRLIDAVAGLIGPPQPKAA